MVSQTTLSGTLTQLPQLCQVSWSRCPCSKANPTAAVVLSSPGRASLLFQDTGNSKPGLPHALSPSGHCWKRKQSKSMLYYHKIQDCRPRASPTAAETHTSTSTGPGMPSLCPAAHACQASPTATSCRTERAARAALKERCVPALLSAAFHLQQAGLSTAPSIQDGGGIVRCGTSINISKRNRRHDKR